MPAGMKLRRGRSRIGIAFTAKHKDLLSRESGQEGNMWEILGVRPAKVILVVLYASPSASKID